uniref:hypothetical protein n=1 Tax=Prosthecobacter sp. TaxID=1965333 RepID=UPI003783CB9A
MLHQEVAVIFVIASGEVKHRPREVFCQQWDGVPYFGRIQPVVAWAEIHKVAVTREDMALITHHKGVIDDMAAGITPARH